MENNDVVTDTVKTEEIAEEKAERTWTRAEVNKMIAAEKTKAVTQALED